MKQINIIFDNISKTFDRQKLYEHLSGELHAGHYYAVTGKNGSGKSTFLKIIAGLIKPTAGNIKYFAGNKELSLPLFRSHLGLLSPEIQFYRELTAEENLRFFTTQADKRLSAEAINALLQKVSLPVNRHDKIQVFSTGMLQRLKMALLLGLDRPVWLLDEPTSNLDEEGCHLFETIINQACQSGHTILTATNDPAEVRYADNILQLT